MGRFYEIVGSVSSVSASNNLVEITAASDTCVAIHYFHVSQLTLAGNAQLSIYTVALRRLSIAGSSGSGSATAKQINKGDADASFSMAVGNTSLGSLDALLTAQLWNNQSGCFHRGVPPNVIEPSGIVALTFDATPVSAIDIGFNLLVEELGG